MVLDLGVVVGSRQRPAIDSSVPGDASAIDANVMAIDANVMAIVADAKADAVDAVVSAVSPRVAPGALCVPSVSGPDLNFDRGSALFHRDPVETEGGKGKG